MKAARSIETLVPIYRTIWRQTTEYRKLYLVWAMPTQDRTGP